MGSKRYKPSRYYMYNRVRDFFDKYKFVPGQCLLIGDTLNGKGSNTALTDMLPANCNIIVPDYPEVDIQHMPYNDGTFDFVLSDQVLEHVEKPWLAANEINRVLKPNGWAVVTTCLMNHLHGVPGDYFRFTPNGLRVLFKDGWLEEQCEGYGNIPFINKVLTGAFTQPVKPGSSLAEEVTTNNDGKNLYLVWYIGKKVD